MRSVSAIDAGDIDGDGLVDIGAFGGDNAAGLAWFESPNDPSTGTWTRHDFTTPATTRPFVGAAKFGDVDGDGDLDVVVSMDNHSKITKSAYIYWWENPRPAAAATTAWTVRTVQSNLGVHHINDMALADMDDDGRLDIVVRSLDVNQLHIYFQNSKTSWFHRSMDATPFGDRGEGFALGNIDRSGNVDITICGHWLEAPSDPRTQDYTVHGIDTGYCDVNANTKEAVGDIDGNGRPDVIISPAEGYRSGGNHVLAWYEGPASPTTVSSWVRHVVDSNLNGAHTVGLADMDADGDLDVLSGVAWNNWDQSMAVRIFFNLGSGNFGSAQVVANDRGLYTGVAADVGGDGDMDIIGQQTYGGSARPWLYVSQESSGQAATCNDGIVNQGEEEVDCGGPCPACPGPECGNGELEDGEECDNDSPSCNDNCTLASCSDGIANQGEEDVDCGGPCDACETSCEETDSCEDASTGGEPDGGGGTCTDGVQNGNETGVDCGGACDPCPELLDCGMPPPCGDAGMMMDGSQSVDAGTDPAAASDAAVMMDDAGNMIDDGTHASAPDPGTDAAGGQSPGGPGMAPGGGMVERPPVASDDGGAPSNGCP